MSEDRPENDVPRPPDPELPAYSEDGVDLTLIRWMLSLSPLQRLQVLQQTVQSIQKLRNARPRD
jgi:hypothetical protein